MEKFLVASILVLFLDIVSLIPSSACPYCPYPYKSPPPPPPPHKKVACPPPPKVKPPPPPPKLKPPPPPPPPKLKPPPPPKITPSPKINPPPPPKITPSPKINPPPPPPKITPAPPPPPPSTILLPPPPIVIPPPPPPVTPQVPCPPPPPPPQVPCPPPPVTPTCPINTLKLDACVDLLGGLVHIGVGQSATSTCCPVLGGLADLDAALCLCTAIKAKLLNINTILPIVLEVLLDCGKHLPPDYQCPA